MQTSRRLCSVAILAVTTLGLTAATGARAPARAAQADPAILTHISPALPLRERVFMYGVLASLEPQYRQNVIVLQNDGSVHVNRPELLPDVRVIRDVPGRPGLAVDAAGRLVPIPDESGAGVDASSTCNNAGKTGCAHRRLSDGGFTVSDADVTFPCSSMSLVTGDAGYVYTGGHNPATLLEVDAGLQIQGQTSNASIQTYIHSGGHQGMIVYNPAQGPEHVLCSPDPAVHEHYQPLRNDPTHVMLALTLLNGSQFREGGTEQTAVMQLTNNATAPGQCKTCEVKRITSLATKNTTGPDGSFVGVTNPGSNPMPAVVWTNSTHTYLTSNGLGPTTKFKELNNPLNLGGQPPVYLCILADPKSSQNETIGLNYTQGAAGGPGCPVF